MKTLYYNAGSKLITILKVDDETALLYNPIDYALIRRDDVEKVIGKEEYDRNYNNFCWGE